MALPDPTRDDIDAPADAARYAEASAALVDAVGAAVPGWIERLVTDRLTAWRGSVDSGQRSRAAAAGEAVRAEAVPAVRRLVEADIDAQTANPLALLRTATHHATRALADAGVPPVVRDEFSERAFPDDEYDLVPASWDDIDPTLIEPGLTWSAAKAFLFKSRRRREGRT